MKSIMLQEFELIIYYAKAKLKAESYRHFAGYFWWVLDPLFGVAIYYFLFKVLMNRGENNYVAFLMLGLILWKWISEGITKSSGAILSGLGLLKKIKLNAYIFPVTEILKDTFKFFVIFFIVIIVFGLFISGITFNHLFLPIMFLVSIIFVSGAGIFLSSITPFLPDLQFVISYCMRLLFYASSVLYSDDKIPEKFKLFLEINPIANLIKGFRQIILNLSPPSLFIMSYPLIWGLVLGLVGILIIRNKNQEYAKLY